uniref:Uncharacterized protein n=1 Tax=Steinernema glaseri TaxID=37863 RepID=A0A1I7Z1U9_9BILA
MRSDILHPSTCLGSRHVFWVGRHSKSGSHQRSSIPTRRIRFTGVRRRPFRRKGREGRAPTVRLDTAAKTDPSPSTHSYGGNRRLRIALGTDRMSHSSRSRVECLLFTHRRDNAELQIVFENETPVTPSAMP